MSKTGIHKVQRDEAEQKETKSRTEIVVGSWCSLSTA